MVLLEVAVEVSDFGDTKTFLHPFVTWGKGSVSLRYRASKGNAMQAQAHYFGCRCECQQQNADHTDYSSAG